MTCSHCKQPHEGQNHICWRCLVRRDLVTDCRRRERKQRAEDAEMLGILVMVVLCLTTMGVIVVADRMERRVDVQVTDLGGAP